MIGYGSSHVSLQAIPRERGRVDRVKREPTGRSLLAQERSARSKSVIEAAAEKLPKTKNEIQRLIIAELRTFAECEKTWGIVVVPIVDDTGTATWTVSRFHRGQSSAYACDRALQRIVPHYQRLYDLAPTH